MTDVLDGVPVSLAGITQGWILAYAGALLRARQDREINVLDFGVVLDAVSDAQRSANRSAIQLALDTGQPVWFPRGTYQIDASLLYSAGQVIRGAGKYVSSIFVFAAVAVFAPKTLGVAQTLHARFADLGLWNGLTGEGGAPSIPAGSVGLDLTGASFTTVSRCLCEYHEIGILDQQDPALLPPAGGYYNTIDDCYVAGSTKGLVWRGSANGNHLRGGRFAGCDTAVEAGACTDNSIHGVAIEHAKTYGVHLLAGAIACTVSGCHFEHNNDNAVIGGGAMVIEAGARGNHEWGNSWGNVQDTCLDHDGGNLVESILVASLPAARSGRGGGQKLCVNASCDVSQAGGVADGWSFPTAEPHTTLSLDATSLPYVGTARSRAQKIAIAAPGASGRYLERYVQVIPGQPYTVSGWFRVTGSPTFAFKVAAWPSGVQLYYTGILDPAVLGTGWIYVRKTLVATQEKFRLYVDNLATAGTATLWLKDVDVESGLLPTQAEPSELPLFLEHVGNPIASAATIAVWQPIVHVTGAATIATITPPVGWSGRITLIADAGSTWTWSAAGNIALAAAGPVTPLRAYGFVFDLRTARWYPT